MSGEGMFTYLNNRFKMLVVQDQRKSNSETVTISLTCKILEDNGNKNSMPQMETIGGIAVIASMQVKQTKKRCAAVTRKFSYASRFADKMCLRGGQERQVP
jgi:hypothetical protein